MKEDVTKLVPSYNLVSKDRKQKCCITFYKKYEETGKVCVTLVTEIKPYEKLGCITCSYAVGQNKGCFATATMKAVA